MNAGLGNSRHGVVTSDCGIGMEALRLLRTCRCVARSRGLWMHDEIKVAQEPEVCNHEARGA